VSLQRRAQNSELRVACGGLCHSSNIQPIELALRLPEALSDTALNPITYHCFLGYTARHRQAKTRVTKGICTRMHRKEIVANTASLAGYFA
jgi:hypothetical protein